MNGNQKKAAQLGMPQGTAANRLRKSIVFMLLKELNKNFCHQCGAEIESEKELSIEHKIPWLDSENPIQKFFDLDNIAFSHLDCNRLAAKRKPFGHPSGRSYKMGCRCDECKDFKKIEMRKHRQKLGDSSGVQNNSLTKNRPVFESQSPN